MPKLSILPEVPNGQESAKQLYQQRTVSERINSQAKTLGIEQPKVRNGHSVVNLNTLTYIVTNARAL